MNCWGDGRIVGPASVAELFSSHFGRGGGGEKRKETHQHPQVSLLMTQLKCTFVYYYYFYYCCDSCCGETVDCGASRWTWRSLPICGTWRCRDVLAYRSVWGGEKNKSRLLLRDFLRYNNNNKIIRGLFCHCTAV